MTEVGETFLRETLVKAVIKQKELYGKIDLANAVEKSLRITLENRDKELELARAVVEAARSALKMCIVGQISLPTVSHLNKVLDTYDQREQ